MLLPVSNDLEFLAEGMSSLSVKAKQVSERVDVTMKENHRITQDGWFQDVRHIVFDSEDYLT